MGTMEIMEATEPAMVGTFEETLTTKVHTGIGITLETTTAHTNIARECTTDPTTVASTFDIDS